MQTILNLLTRDGVVYMDFHPSLSATQYAYLLELSTQTSGKPELVAKVTEWTKAEGLLVNFDETKGPPD